MPENGTAHLAQQEIEIFSLMIIRDHPSRDARTSTRVPIGIGIIGRGIGQVQLLLQRRSRMLRMSREPVGV